MLRTLLVLASTLGVMLVAGCAESDGDETDREPAGSAVPATPDSAEADATERSEADGDAQTRTDSVPESLDFTGTTVAGDAFEGASLAGRPTLLWFWAPWCPTCRGQISQVEGLAADYAGELNVIGVGSLDSAEAIEGFADDVDEITHLEDAEGELWQRFGVTEQSSFVLLDADGSVAFEAGYGGTEELEAQVDDVVG